MKPSDACAALIRRFEGLRTRAYLCPAGKPTIGYGHTGPDVRLGLVWSPAQCEAALAADLAMAGDAVDKLTRGAATTQGQFDAMVAFAFNLGAGKLGSSTLLRLHNSGNHAGAAEQFSRWDKATVDGVLTPLRGLIARRAAEAALYRS